MRLRPPLQLEGGFRQHKFPLAVSPLLNPVLQFWCKINLSASKSFFSPKISKIKEKRNPTGQFYRLSRLCTAKCDKWPIFLQHLRVDPTVYPLEVAHLQNLVRIGILNFQNSSFLELKLKFQTKSTQRTFHLTSMSSREQEHAGPVLEVAQRRIRYLRAC